MLTLTLKTPKFDLILSKCYFKKKNMIFKARVIELFPVEEQTGKLSW